MTYSTIMIHLDVGSPNDAVLRVGASLAQRFEANVIGIAACRPTQLMAESGYASGEMIAMDLAEIAKETVQAEASFRTALHGKCAGLTWRAVTGEILLADYVAQEARAADLIVTGPDKGWNAFDSSRRVVVSDLVLHAGRPVLIVPPEAATPNLETVLVGWKDRREARRAIADALPLLKMAGRVFVMEIAAADDLADARRRVADVGHWLERHAIASEAMVVASVGDDASQLNGIALDTRASVVVAGAYGHNRLREWVLGGVTRTLLIRPDRCVLLSH